MKTGFSKLPLLVIIAGVIFLAPLVIGWYVTGAYKLRSETLPQVTRKVIVIGVVYYLYLWVGVQMSLSLSEQGMPEHILTHTVPWLSGVMPSSYPLAIVMTYATLGLLIVFLVWNAIKTQRSLVDLSGVQHFFLVLLGTAWAYALMYDFAYYFAGNTCRPNFLVTTCLNIGTHANYFASGSAVIYLLRVTNKMVMGETGAIELCGVPIRAVEGGGMFMLFAIPYPYFIYTFFMSLYEVDLGGWALYHSPDGRNRAAKLLHR